MPFREVNDKAMKDLASMDKHESFEQLCYEHLWSSYRLAPYLAKMRASLDGFQRTAVYPSARIW